MASLPATRLNKFISETGYCSRREADKLIEQRRVTLNGRVAGLGDKVAADDQVSIDGQPLQVTQKNAVYLAFNKPVGITCTTERHVAGNIIDFIRYPERIFPVGRLDKPSEGLIFLTSDGAIVNKILRAGNQHEKEYEVSVNESITPDFVRKMQQGVPILDTVTRPCVLIPTGRYTFRIVLTQGLNRQIRRMCTQLGYTVTRLKRLRIMNVTLTGLPPGKWRHLTTQEMAEINARTAVSTNTEEGSIFDEE